MKTLLKKSGVFFTVLCLSLFMLYSGTAEGQCVQCNGNASQIGSINGTKGINLGRNAYPGLGIGGVDATTMGDSTVALGRESTAMGNNTKANGRESTTMGLNTIAEGRAATATGNGTTSGGNTNFFVNQNKVGINTITPTAVLQVDGDNIGQFSTGTFQGVTSSDRWSEIGKVLFDVLLNWDFHGTRHQFGKYDFHSGITVDDAGTKNAIIAWQNSSGAFDLPLNFVYKNGTNAEFLMTILPSGNIGINEDDAGAKLHVQGGDIAQVNNGSLYSNGTNASWAQLGNRGSNGIGLTEYGRINKYEKFGFFSGLQKRDGSTVYDGVISWSDSLHNNDDWEYDPEFDPQPPTLPSEGTKLRFAWIDNDLTDNVHTKMQIFANGLVSIAESDPPYTILDEQRISLRYGLYIDNNTYLNGNLEVQGSANIVSDRSLKKSIEPIKNPLELINNLEGHYFEFKRDKIFHLPKGRHLGFIAQEVEKVVPEVVNDMPTGEKGLEYQNLTALLVEGIKQQQKQLEKQSNKIDELETRLKMVEKQLSQESLELPGKYKGNSKSNMNSGGNSNRLEQNTPNPFNEETNINYHLNDEVTDASIIIYDLQGKQKAHYNLDTKAEENISIPANSFVPGMYYYTLFADGKIVDTKRMVITRPN